MEANKATCPNCKIPSTQEDIDKGFCPVCGVEYPTVQDIINPAVGNQDPIREMADPKLYEALGKWFALSYKIMFSPMDAEGSAERNRLSTYITQRFNGLVATGKATNTDAVLCRHYAECLTGQNEFYKLAVHAVVGDQQGLKPEIIDGRLVICPSETDKLKGMEKRRKRHPKTQE